MARRAAASRNWRAILRSPFFRQPSRKIPASPMGVHSANALRADNFEPFLEGEVMEPFPARSDFEIAAAVAPVIDSVVVAVLPLGVTGFGSKLTVAFEAGLRVAVNVIGLV